jgi:SepF-like predicted cell division protein (DUF552 family)
VDAQSRARRGDDHPSAGEGRIAVELRRTAATFHCGWDIISVLDEETITPQQVRVA